MQNFLATLNQVFEAGIAITALSLFIRALTFNLRDRVSRAFAIILACVMVSSAGEAVSRAVAQSPSLEAWMRFQWLGIIFIPAAYMHLSDALLETTGRPSRGRRRLAVRLAYLLSALFLIALPSALVGPLVTGGQPLPHLSRTWLSWVFTVYYGLVMLLAISTIWRAFNRTVQSASRRRMTYLLAGSAALAIGVYPFLLLGSSFAGYYPIFFLVLAALGNLLVFYALVAMAYATAFFGVPWPDRVVKSRLIKWLLRGPVTVFIILFFIPGVDDVSRLLNTRETVVLPIFVVVSVLLIEHLITLTAPVLERVMLFNSESEDVRLIQTLQERILTSGDLRQFLEAVLAAVCDRLQTRTAFIAALDGQQADILMQVGDKDLLGGQDLGAELLKLVANNGHNEQIFSWGDFWLTPLHDPETATLLGLLGVQRTGEASPPEEQQEALIALAERAALALEDRRRQSQVLESLQALSPRVERIQRLRAAALYDQSEVLSDPDAVSGNEVSRWVKEALTHYWGGPKLTQSPLRGLQVVQRAIDDHDGNPANAMRAILREAIERNRPAGEPHLTGEWMLYNLLEMKFLQGRKVREVARRLAMSEADLYRKQRIAIESVSRTLLEMERDLRAQS